MYSHKIIRQTEKKVDEHIKRITEQTNKAIKTRIKGAIEDMKNELVAIKGFVKCADTKINKHLLTHCELPETLELVQGEEK